MNNLVPSVDFDMSIGAPITKAEVLDLLRQSFMVEVETMVDDRVEKAKDVALAEFRAKAEKFESQLERQEKLIGFYKGDIKALNREISTMAHKEVEKEEAQLEKDKKIAMLEKRLAEMELERCNTKLDDLDKHAHYERNIKLLKASIVTIATAGLGVHTIIEEGTNESLIRSMVPKTRYHEAVAIQEKLKKDVEQIAFENQQLEKFKTK